MNVDRNCICCGSYNIQYYKSVYQYHLPKVNDDMEFCIYLFQCVDCSFPYYTSYLAWVSGMQSGVIREYREKYNL